MEAFFDNLQNLVCGLISGFILFQSAIVAPTIFQTLPENQAGPFLRSLFPRLFKLCAALMGLNALIAIYFDDLVSTCGFILGVFLMIFCLFLVPKINSARDQRNESAFNRLHLTTVLSTLIVLSMNLWFSLF